MAEAHRGVLADAPRHACRSNISHVDVLQVNTYAEATWMLATVTQVARDLYSSRTAARFGRSSAVDLPCQACELAGYLGRQEVLGHPWERRKRSGSGVDSLQTAFIAHCHVSDGHVAEDEPSQGSGSRKRFGLAVCLRGGIHVVGFVSVVSAR